MGGWVGWRAGGWVGGFALKCFRAQGVLVLSLELLYRVQ